MKNRLRDNDNTEVDMTTLDRKNAVYLSDEPVFSFRLKDKWSALTHLGGFIAGIILMPVLLIRASVRGADMISLSAYSVFMLSMILLYGASFSYHAFNISEKANMILKKTDHMSIFILIAGSYTPICLIALRNTIGPVLLAVIWACALAGMIFKFFWVGCPKWVSSVIYTAMGWLCIFCLPAITNAAGLPAVLWLAAGGVLYSIGAVFYAVKPKFITSREFGCHEIFHCFVLAGTFCHLVVNLHYLCAISLI